jgi:hypothetical protein
MAFGHTSLPSRIWSFGASDATIHLECVQEQILAGHRYKNALIAQERVRRKEVHAATVALFPLLLAAETRADALDEELKAARAELKQLSASERRRHKATPEQKARIASLNDELKAQRAIAKAEKLRAYGPTELKTARKAKPRNAALIARLEQAWLAAEPAARALKIELQAIDARDNEVRKQLRDASGLYWGTYLVVEKSMQGSRVGAPPEFRHWNGEGCVAVQIQSTRPLSAGDLIGGNDTRLRVEEIDGRHVAYLRIGSEGRDPIFAAVPIVLHRPLPPDAKITWAYLRRRRIGTHMKWTFQLVLAKKEWIRTDTANAVGGVGVDVGWRIVPGGLRVAYWEGSDGEHGELVLAERHLTMWAKSAELQSTCGTHLDAIRPVLADWLRTLPELPEWLAVRFASREERDAKTLPTPAVAAARLAHWRSTYRLAALVVEWRDKRIPGDDVPHPDAARLRALLQLDAQHYGRPESVFELCEAWRRKDKHLFDWLSFTRVRAIRRRDDVYRNFAAMLRRRYQFAGAEKLNLPDLKELPQPEEDPVDAATRKNIGLAAPGRLLALLGESMEVRKVSAVDTTRRHFECGQYSGESDPKLLMHTCQHCHVMFDQDRNAAKNLLRAASEQGPNQAP